MKKVFSDTLDQGGTMTMAGCSCSCSCSCSCTCACEGELVQAKVDSYSSTKTDNSTTKSTNESVTLADLQQHPN